MNSDRRRGRPTGPPAEPLERKDPMKQVPLILVIEDDALLRMLMFRALEAAGYRVVAVSTALEAVSVMRRGHPDLILTDLALPDLDGAEAALSIKNEPGMAATPVVLTSSAPNLADRACETEAVDCIAKPFTLRNLVGRIRRALERSETYNQP
jgi:CheY-like chemotaxis protein